MRELRLAEITLKIYPESEGHCLFLHAAYRFALHLVEWCHRSPSIRRGYVRVPTPGARSGPKDEPVVHSV